MTNSKNRCAIECTHLRGAPSAISIAVIPNDHISLCKIHKNPGQSLSFICCHSIVLTQKQTVLLLPCSHRWSQGSHHRQWPQVPSSKVCQWRCSYVQPSCPTGRSPQNQLNVDKGSRGIGPTALYFCNTITKNCQAFNIPSLTSAFSVSSTFWPLMSLWITLWAWRCERPWTQTKQRKLVTKSWLLLQTYFDRCDCNLSPLGSLCRCKQSSPPLESCP